MVRMHHSRLFLTVCSSALLFASSCSSPPAPQPPELAGQRAPDQQIELDLRKRYDVWTGGSFFSGHPESNAVYRNCRIIGFTGGGTREDVGSFPMKAIGHFTGWLVLQRADGRKIFLPAAQIVRLEEA